MKFFDEMKSSGVIKAHGFSAHNDLMNLHERNNKELFYDVIMVPFNHKGSFVHSVTGRFSEWDQKRLIAALTDAGNKGIGVIAMKTCSGGKYSPSPGIEPSYREAVRWVIQHPFISSAAIAMANFEQVDEYHGLKAALKYNYYNASATINVLPPMKIRSFSDASALAAATADFTSGKHCTFEIPSGSFSHQDFLIESPRNRSLCEVIGC